MKKILFIVLLSIPFLAQTKTLTIYTKPGCNNCKYTKFMLQRNGIAFYDLSLDDKENAAEMLEKLKSATYTGRIHLPVIFENDSILLHPTIPHDDSSLYFLIEKIIAQKELYASDSNQTEIIISDEEDGDCVMNQ